MLAVEQALRAEHDWLWAQHPAPHLHLFGEVTHMRMNEWSQMMINLFHRFETTKVQAASNSLKNDFFMAGLYLFSQAHTKKTTIRLTEKFIDETEKRVRNRINLLYRKSEH